MTTLETRRSAKGRIAALSPDDRAFVLLRTVFVVAPILFGLDKFFNVMTDWTHYLAPWINDLVPGSAATDMHLVGVVEIAAGIIVALAPRWGGYIVALWLAGIIVNLLTFSGFYDVALRDFGLLVAALALAQLAQGRHGFWGARVPAGGEKMAP